MSPRDNVHEHDFRPNGLPDSEPDPGRSRVLPPSNGSNRGLIATIIIATIALITMFAIFIGGVHSQIQSLQAEAAADRSEAAKDRRALQDAMDSFRSEMQRLAQRQSYIEGRADGAAGT